MPQVWNGRFHIWNGMNLPYFHTCLFRPFGLLSGKREKFLSPLKLLTPITGLPFASTLAQCRAASVCWVAASATCQVARTPTRVRDAKPDCLCCVGGMIHQTHAQPSKTRPIKLARDALSLMAIMPFVCMTFWNDRLVGFCQIALFGSNQTGAVWCRGVLCAFSTATMLDASKHQNC